METNDFYSTLLNDAWTVYMTFSGILISIITLLYSVILGKRSELEVYAEQTKLGHSDPMMRKQHQITIKVIKKLVSINRWVFAILCVSLFNWRKRSIPTHSGWLYPLTFDAEKGLKEA